MLTLTTRTETFQPHRVASYQAYGDASYVVEALAWSTVDTLDAYDRDRAAARHALALGLRILRAQRREILHTGSPTCGCEPGASVGNAVFCRRCGTCLAVSD